MTAARTPEYPFGFELDVAFHLAGCRLTIMASVRNTGEFPLPASLGFHPALRWPLPYGAARADHYLEFEQDEPAPIRRLDAARSAHPAAACHAGARQASAAGGCAVR